ncbi:hypothetical protein DMH27_15205 [Raoultella planticola]|uniref:Uncharacterized protein n=1 Tax=Raoultella planticola TaxID=575 RepID=A0A5P6AB91_RAOPL|nr:hypothetical protein [Raoultella planticola]QFG77015.1 hypothetical protein DMB90_22620 [Raoultella planticola]
MPSAGVNKQHVVPGQHGRIGFDAGIVKLAIKHDFEAWEIRPLHVTGCRAAVGGKSDLPDRRRAFD